MRAIVSNLSLDVPSLGNPVAIAICTRSTNPQNPSICLKNPHAPAKTRPQQPQLSNHLERQKRPGQIRITRDFTATRTPAFLYRRHATIIPQRQRRAQRALLEDIDLTVPPVQRRASVISKTKPAIVPEVDRHAVDLGFERRDCLSEEGGHGSSEDWRDARINQQFLFRAGSFGIAEASALVGVLHG